MTFDATGMAFTQCDSLILSAFRALEVGQSMDVVHDHDPKHLFARLRSEMPGGFGWHCIESGPGVWRIRIRLLATLWADGDYGTSAMALA